MSTVRLDSFDLQLPDEDDCWHLDEPHRVVIRRRLPSALAQPPVYVAAKWSLGEGPPLSYATRETAEEIEPSDAYVRVGINARAAWARSKGEGVKVVVFDNGVDFRHPSLAPNVSLEDARDFDQDSQGRSYDQEGQIDNRFNAHGTACSGIIAAAHLDGVRVVGIAPEARLVPIRISTNLGTEALINALEHARHVADVILLPRYLPPSQELTDKIREIAQELPVVCASGNDGIGSLVYPACLAGTIAVGACNEKGWRSTYSQYGEGLDLVAPSSDLANDDADVVRLDLDEANFRVRAEEERQARLNGERPPPSQARDLRELTELLQKADWVQPLEWEEWHLDRFGPLSIATTDHTGDFGYNDEPAGDFCLATGDVGFGGTSAAAAQVAGVIALMLSACLEKHHGDRDEVRKYLPPDTIRSILKDTAYKEGDGYLHVELERRTFEAEFGAGLVNAAAAVEAAVAAC